MTNKEEINNDGYDLMIKILISIFLVILILSIFVTNYILLNILVSINKNIDSSNSFPEIEYQNISFQFNEEEIRIFNEEGNMMLSRDIIKSQNYFSHNLMIETESDKPIICIEGIFENVDIDSIRISIPEDYAVQKLNYKVWCFENYEGLDSWFHLEQEYSDLEPKQNVIISFWEERQ